MYKQDLVLNNLQGLICHNIQPTSPLDAIQCYNQIIQNSLYLLDSDSYEEPIPQEMSLLNILIMKILTIF